MCSCSPGINPIGKRGRAVTGMRARDLQLEAAHGPRRALVADGYPRTREALEHAGYATEAVPVREAACVDGGLSCMSLRIPAAGSR